MNSTIVPTISDDASPTDDGATAAAPATPRQAPPSALVQTRDLTRIWGKGHAAQIGVQGVDLDIARGEVVAIVGPSGSGKSTLGALLAGIDTPTSGSLVIDGVRIDSLKRDRLAAWRGGNVGIVFQDFHLLPTLTAVENVELALDLAGHARRGRKQLAREALASVGLADKHKRLPTQLSGGEQQRVGIARAIVKRPPLLIADEPTGSLDQRSGHEVFEIVITLASAGTTVVFITHDAELAAAAHQTVNIVDGRIAPPSHTFALAGEAQS